MNRLFAYGTLLFPEVLRVVTGRALDARPATLDRHRRHRVVGEIFPAVIEAGDDDRVVGALYDGLTGDDWRRLDRFEGDLYDRRVVVVRCGGARVEAQTYVLGAAARHRLDARAWDPEAFALEHLAGFLERIRRGPEPRAV